MSVLSEDPRQPTEGERLLARECAALAQRAASYLSEVAAGDANVSNLLVERMWEFSAFPIATTDELQRLRRTDV